MCVATSATTCVLRGVDTALTTAEIEAALLPQVGTVIVSRFRKTRGLQHRPLPLCRVLCAGRDALQQMGTLLREGALLNGERISAEVDQAGPDSTAAAGRQQRESPTQGASDGRWGTGLIEQRARALAKQSGAARGSKQGTAARESVVLTLRATSGTAVLVRVEPVVRAGTQADAAGGNGPPAAEAWPLHAAAERRDAEAVTAHLAAGADAASAKPNGLSPLMVAAARGAAACARLLLAADAAAVARKSHAGRTAAEYARMHGHAALASELEEAERAEQRRRDVLGAGAGAVRCPVCDVQVKARSSLDHLQRRVASGEETNPYVLRFSSSAAARALAAPAWHALRGLKQLRKEVTESMSMLSLVERLMRTHHPELAALGETSEPAEGESGGDGGGEATGGGDGGGGGGDVQCGVRAEGEGGACEAICPDLPACHVVDLCCGRSLTLGGSPRPRQLASARAAVAALIASGSQAALTAHLLPRSSTTAIDLVLPCALPHYDTLLPCPPAAGSGVGGVRYLRLDVLSDAFVDALRCRVAALPASTPCYLVGMHLCGELSLRAIRAFREIPRMAALVLAPCCLPSRASPCAPAALFASSLQHAQHAAWCELLAARCAEVPHAAVERWDDRHVASERRTIILAKRKRTS